MIISHGSRVKQIETSNGYGYATDRMTTSLKNLGHTITQNDVEAEVEIWFDQPHHWEWQKDKLLNRTSTSYTYGHQYRIGYHPWESTELKKDWLEAMNQTDEIWTPSPLIAEWYKEAGIKRPIHVYEHGVDKIWAPKKRELGDGPLVFLHCGYEAGRKNGSQTSNAFVKAFPDRKDVKLIMKMISKGFNVERTGKITWINRRMDLPEMVNLFHESHVYLYPSSGEGFGLTPLQAMSTGMPTITLPAWAPYHEFLEPSLGISSQLKASPMPEEHPGMMFRPNFDELIDILRYTADNYETLHNNALARVPEIQKKYDWDNLTKNAFDALQKRMN